MVKPSLWLAVSMMKPRPWVRSVPGTNDTYPCLTLLLEAEENASESTVLPQSGSPTADGSSAASARRYREVSLTAAPDLAEFERRARTAPKVQLAAMREQAMEAGEIALAAVLYVTWSERFPPRLPRRYQRLSRRG
jgi:hypothetical protein